MVVSKQLRLAVETEKERRGKLENDAATYHMAQVGHGYGRKKKSKTGEDGSFDTAHVGPGDRGRKKIKEKNELDLDLIWI